MMRRNIIERIQTIAPFFMYDKDPYIVLSEGKLYWIVDGYTVSANYPYSQPDPQTGLNYIRNSVKVVVDAYEGAITFYQSDMTDPIVNTARQDFPGPPKAAGGYAGVAQRAHQVPGGAVPHSVESALDLSYD